MKKAILVIALLLATGLPAAAQTGTAFGVRVGMNFATLSFDPDEDDTKSKTGLVAGAFATMPVNARFAFQPEVLFSMQGAKADNDGDDFTIKLDYLNVPLLGKINLSTGDNPVALLIGPQIGFRTSAKATGGGEEEDLKDDTEGTDWGLVTGLSATMRNFVFDARYTWGLTNIAKDDEEKVKNRVFAISVGILFR